MIKDTICSAIKEHTKYVYPYSHYTCTNILPVDVVDDLLAVEAETFLEKSDLDYGIEGPIGVRSEVYRHCDMLISSAPEKYKRDVIVKDVERTYSVVRWDQLLNDFKQLELAEQHQEPIYFTFGNNRLTCINGWDTFMYKITHQDIDVVENCYVFSETDISSFLTGIGVKPGDYSECCNNFRMRYRQYDFPHVDQLAQAFSHADVTSLLKQATGTDVSAGYVNVQYMMDTAFQRFPGVEDLLAGTDLILQVELTKSDDTPVTIGICRGETPIKNLEINFNNAFITTGEKKFVMNTISTHDCKKQRRYLRVSYQSHTYDEDSSAVLHKCN